MTDGERFVPSDSDFTEIMVNLERYFYAMHYCKDKVVIDAGCGSGLGTYLFSLVAKNIYAVDYEELETLGSLLKYPLKCPVEWLKRDLDTDILPEADVCVALEVIEHLKHPDFFLKNLKVKELVFSIPRESLAVSTWHVQDFRTFDDIKAFLEDYITVETYHTQYNKWIYGVGVFA